MKTLLHFAHEHVEFRIPEVRSIARIFGIDLKLQDSYHSEDPFLVVELPSREHAVNITRRSVLIKSSVELLVQADNYTSFYRKISSIDPSLTDTPSFRVKVDSFNRTLTQQDKISKIERLTNESVPFKGKVVLGDACHTTYHLLEYYQRNQPHPRHIYFGKWICDGQREGLKKYDLKTRKFIGNTSMDVTLSMIMANMAMARVGSLVYDPFVGTGSLLVSSAHYGSHVMGSDIDFNLVTGVGKSSRCGQKWRSREESIRNNLQQYALEGKYVDVFIGDAALLCRLWRRPYCGGGDDNDGLNVGGGDNDGGNVGGGDNDGGNVGGGDNDGGNVGGGDNDGGNVGVYDKNGEDFNTHHHHNHLRLPHHPQQPLFDAIITDPPYGIREPTQKVGFKTEPLGEFHIDEELRDKHFPCKRSYHLGDLLSDLLTFAAMHLCIGGRLVFWMPVYKQDYSESNVPEHECLRVVSNCEQSLNAKVARRMITMEKISHYAECLGDGQATIQSDHYADASFRQKYFRPHPSNIMPARTAVDNIQNIITSSNKSTTISNNTTTLTTNDSTDNTTTLTTNDSTDNTTTLTTNDSTDNTTTLTTNDSTNNTTTLTVNDSTNKTTNN